MREYGNQAEYGGGAVICQRQPKFEIGDILRRTFPRNSLLIVAIVIFGFGFGLLRLVVLALRLGIWEGSIGFTDPEVVN